MKSNVTTVDDYLAQVPEWQRKNLALFRSIISANDPGVVEAIKWGVPTFLHGATVLFAMSAFKAHTKFNFIHNGALIDDADGLFNNGFDSTKSRGIDLKEGESIDEAALTRLTKRAIDAA